MDIHQRRKRVLIVEDEPALASVLKIQLESRGYSCDTAHDGMTGLQLIEQADYSVVLMDHRMPGMSGLEVVKLLKGRGMPVPVIMMSVGGDHEIVVEAMRLGASDFIVKDSETRYFQHLPLVIERVIREYESAKTLKRLEEEKSRLLVRLEKTNSLLEESIREFYDSNVQLVESNAALEEFARLASHDLQEPLRKIENFSQILLDDYAPRLDEQGQHYLDIVMKSAQRMRQLIRDVLDYSRTGDESLTVTAVDLNQSVLAARENLSETIRFRQAVVTSGALPTVQGNPTQLTRLFQNFISNGLKFNQATPPEVEIMALNEAGVWKIRIRDNGIGINPEHMNKLFQPFRRLHDQSQYMGSGIGLAACKKIVQRHGGQIGVNSQVGLGTTFWFTLPKIKLNDNSNGGSDTGAPLLEKEQIL